MLLSSDNVKAVITPIFLDNELNEDIVIGMCCTRHTTLYGYYTKGKETYVRKITMTSVNAEEPVTAELSLPEDGEAFIGVKTVTKVEYQTEYWSPPSEAGPYNPDALSTHIDSFTGSDML